MAEYRVKLTMEGLHDEDGNVRLKDFVGRVQALSNILAKIDAATSGGQRATSFRVVDLSHSSPATVVLAGYTMRGRPDTRAALVSNFNRALEDIRHGDIPPDVDYSLLEDFRTLTGPVGKSLERIYLAADGKDHHLNEQVFSNITKELASYEECFGSVEGALEHINIHDNANVFSIYPDIGPAKIKCHFPSRLIEDAKAAVGFIVCVRGFLKYRRRANFPHEVNVDEIEPYPLEGSLPTFDDLRGLAPRATGDLASEDFVARLRDGWEN